MELRIHTFKVEPMVLKSEKMKFLLWLLKQLLLQVEQFRYLGILFMSEGRMDQELDSQTGVTSAVSQTL